jgi:hypothetical protein
VKVILLVPMTAGSGHRGPEGATTDQSVIEEMILGDPTDLLG